MSSSSLSIFLSIAERLTSTYSLSHLFTAGLYSAAATILSLGSPMVPSDAEQSRLRRLWKKPIPFPFETEPSDRHRRLTLALRCLLVLTRERYVLQVRLALRCSLTHCCVSAMSSPTWRRCCRPRRGKSSTGSPCCPSFGKGRSVEIYALFSLLPLLGRTTAISL